MAYFIHPLPLLAVAVLVLNDRYLKFAYPSWWSGKLSDVSGLFFFPLFLCAIVCLLMNLRAGRRGLFAAIVATGLIFILIKIWAPATWIYVRGLEGLGFSIACDVRPKRSLGAFDFTVHLSTRAPLY
jgi:hypothetical protein